MTNPTTPTSQPTNAVTPTPRTDNVYLSNDRSFEDRLKHARQLERDLSTALSSLKAMEAERDEAIKAHGFVWNAARKAAQYFRWAGCPDSIAIEAMNQCHEAEKLAPKWSTDWAIVTPLELHTLRTQLTEARQQLARAEGESNFMKTGNIGIPKTQMPVTMAEGRYPATWCGYVISLDYKGREVEIRTEMGVRGFVPCLVIVSETGAIRVEDTTPTPPSADQEKA